MSIKCIRDFLAISISFLVVMADASAHPITGAGATFPYPLYAKWADAYKRETGIKINYQSIGSGGGINQVKKQTIVFGASDKPLNKKDLDNSSLVQWPQVIGGIVPVINIVGIGRGSLRLNGEVLAKIYLGEILKWDDVAIQALNPQLKLPSAHIVVVHRSDGSGTTFNFTNYLSKVSDDWRKRIGEFSSVVWPVGFGAKGNDGVANNVANIRNSIGYVEYAFIKQTKMNYVKMINRDGSTVEPNIETFQSAATAAQWSGENGFYEILTNEPGTKSWPITAATFILMPNQPKNLSSAIKSLKFFDWAFIQGAGMAEKLDYVPIPPQVIEKIRQSWEKIKGIELKMLSP